MHIVTNPILLNKNCPDITLNKKMEYFGVTHLSGKPISPNWIQRLYKNSELQDFWSLLTSGAN